MAIEWQACFEAQRITCTKTDRLHPLVLDKPVDDALGSDGGHRNLEPVLAGIARAADPQRVAERPKRAALHEAELADTGNDRIENLGRARPLQREQRLFPHVIDGDVAQAAFHIVDVAVLGRAIDDDVEILAPPRRHQIVDNPAVLVEQERIFGLHVLGVAQIARHQPLER